MISLSAQRNLIRREVGMGAGHVDMNRIDAYLYERQIVEIKKGKTDDKSAGIAYLYYRHEKSGREFEFSGSYFRTETWAILIDWAIHVSIGGSCDLVAKHAGDDTKCKGCGKYIFYCDPVVTDDYRFSLCLECCDYVTGLAKTWREYQKKVEATDLDKALEKARADP